MTKIVFHDTETTGLEEKDRILQSAHATYIIQDNNLIFQGYTEEFINPQTEINPEAAAVHGIWKNDIKNAPIWNNSTSKKELENMSKDENVYYCAHNAPFDLAMLRKENIVWDNNRVIDTLRVVRHMYKDLDNKKLQYIRYLWDFDSQEDFENTKKDFNIQKLQAHTALSDIIVLIYLFKQIMKDAIQKQGDFSLKRLVFLSQMPVLEDKITFGNVFPRGTKISEVVHTKYETKFGKKDTTDYFRWVLTNMDLRIETKVSIAFYSIQAAQQNKVDINDYTLKPMIQYASAFLPSMWDYLKQNNVNVEKLRIELIENLKNQYQDDPNFLQEIEFLQNYVDLYQKINKK